jgi:hypothetical protein
VNSEARAAPRLWPAIIQGFCVHRGWSRVHSSGSPAKKPGCTGPSPSCGERSAIASASRSQFCSVTDPRKISAIPSGYSLMPTPHHPAAPQADPTGRAGLDKCRDRTEQYHVCFSLIIGFGRHRPSSIRFASIVARQRQDTTNGLSRYSTPAPESKSFWILRFCDGGERTISAFHTV